MKNELGVKDVMIGDWIRVSYDDSRKGKVTKVMSAKNGDFIEICFDGKHKRYLTFDYFFEPIELTNEMLALNGFSKSSECDWFWMAGFPFNISKNEYSDNPDAYELRTSSGVYGKIQHVHELQNLLRNLGMVELADNFKLER